MKCVRFFATNENQWKLLDWEQDWKDVVVKTLSYTLSHLSFWMDSAFSWGILFDLVFQWDWRCIFFKKKISWKFWPSVSIFSSWPGKHNWKTSRVKQADTIGGRQPNCHLEKVFFKENFGHIANKDELQERLTELKNQTVIDLHGKRATWFYIWATQRVCIELSFLQQLSIFCNQRPCWSRFNLQWINFKYLSRTGIALEIDWKYD